MDRKVTCGIYQIVNTVNGKRYVGSSVNVEKRLNEHFRVLSLGKHHCVALQRAFNKYGRDSFQGGIIKECDNGSLLCEEQKVIDERAEYNSSRTAGSPLGTRHTEKTRRKYSKRMIRQWAEDRESGSGFCDRDFLDKRATAISTAKLSRRNYNEDPTIYHFAHAEHGDVSATQKQMRYSFNLNKCNVNGLVKGRQKSCKGWTLKKAPEGA